MRWFEFANAQGNGICIDIDSPLQVSASPFRAEDLPDITHNLDLEQSRNSVVRRDAANRGKSSVSCGPDTLPGYLLSGGTYRFTWPMRKVSNSANQIVEHNPV